MLELLDRLAGRYGPLVIHQSGGCCDGSSPICLPAGELPAGPHDVLLGVVGEHPRLRRSRSGRALAATRLCGSASPPGPAMGFSLESAEGVHLLALSGEALLGDSAETCQQPQLLHQKARQQEVLAHMLASA